MARRRLNVKFLILLAVPFVLLASAYAVYRYYPPARRLVWGSPETLMAKAKSLVDEGKFQDAIKTYQHVMLVRNSRDAELFTAMGDCYAFRTLEDTQHLRTAQGLWQEALGVDPRYLPALQRMLDLAEEDAEMARGARSAQAWDYVQEIATKVLVADPENVKAKVLQHRAVVQRWLQGIETDIQRVDASTAALIDLAGQEPFNADVMFYVLQSKLNRIQERLRGNDRDGAAETIAEAIKLLDDSLAAHPDDALMHYRAGQALRFLNLVDRRPNEPEKHATRTHDELQKAAELVKPDHPMYAEIKLYYGKLLETSGEAAEAERIYRALNAELPDDLQVRIFLAELLGRNPATREEAASLLQDYPPADARKHSGMKAIIRKNHEIAALTTYLNLRLEGFQPTGQGETAGQDPALKQIEDGYAKLLATPGVADTPMALQIRGRIELAKGQNIQAVQTLDRALKLMPTVGAGDVEQRTSLMFLLARAYILVEQTGEAKSLLLQIVRDNERVVQPRALLVQLLLREGDINGAREHVEVLRQAMPDSPVVVRMMMLTLDREKDKDKVEELYRNLPEATRTEVNEKVQVALYLNKRDEGVRILEAFLAKNPDDVEVIIALAGLYSGGGDAAKAKELLERAMAKAPDRADLKLLLARAAGEDTTELRREMIEKVEDPLRRELLFFRLAMEEGKEADAMQHLAKATEINPSSPDVLELQLRIATAQKQWDKAAQYVETLASQNHDQAGGLLYRVRLMLAKGELDSALDQAGQLTQRMPEFAMSWVVLGQVQQAQAKYADAIRSYSTAVQKQAQNLEAIAGLITCHYRLNQDPEALQWIKQGRLVFPRNAMIRELELTHLLNRSDNPEQVIEPRQKQLDENKEDPRAWLAMGDTYMLVAQKKVSEQDAKPFLEKARDTFQQASAKWPDELEFVRLSTHTLIRLGNHADAEKAIQAIRARPAWQGRAEPTLLLSDFYGTTNQTAKREAVLREYLAAAPQEVSVQLQLSQLLGEQNKIDDAMKVLEANPTHPAVRRQRIELEVAAGRLAEAEKELDAVLAATPDPDPSLLSQQAFIYMNSGRLSEAMTVLNKSLEKDPSHIDSLYFRANINVSLRKELDKAIADLQQVVQAMPNNLDAVALLADAHHYSGDDDSAIRQLEEAIQRRPGSKQMRLRLVHLCSTTTPPRWVQAERTFNDARRLPELAKDVDIMHAEARMWLKRKDASKANEIIVQALKLAPENATLFRTYCEGLLAAKQYRPLLGATDPLVQKKVAAWWVHEARGRAKKALDDKPGALEEFSTGIEVASAANDDAAVLSIVSAIADEIGINQAKARIATRADKGEVTWGFMMARLLQLEGDAAGAISWLERLTASPAIKQQDADAARRTLGTLYLQLDPPDTSKAVAVFRQLLERNPNDPAALNNLACTMILPNSGYTPAEALQYSEKAFKILEARGITDPFVYDTQGYVLVLLGRVEEGISLLRQALDSKPFAEGYYHLGEAYLAPPSPRLPEAEEALKQAQALLDAASRDEQSVDAQLKTKITAALDRARQPAAPPAQ